MDLLYDFRHAVRLLRKSPGFLIVAVLTLSLGIGANTAIFSVARAVFLRSVQFPNPDRLMFLSRGYPGFPEGGGNFTNPAYRDMLQQTTSFESIAAFQEFGALALTDGSEPVRMTINYVTPNYFTMLGAKTAIGRTFRAEEDRPGDADLVVVISHAFWERQFGGARDIVGRTIHLNQQALMVVGVTEESFRDAPGEIDNGQAIDAWIPLGAAYRLTGYSRIDDRNGALLWGLGLMKRGVTERAAQADLDGLAKRLAQMYPGSDAGYTLVANPLKDRLVGMFYRPVWLLIGGSAFILLIGCANVANLLLARLSGRHRELAVRSALGASAGRLARQMLAENFVIVAMAALLGSLVAVWGVSALRTWGSVNLPSVIELGVDRWVLAGSLAASALTLALFGLAPALAGSRTDIRDALNQGGRQGSSMGRSKAAKLLIVSEVSLALMLLVGAGLLMRSFQRMVSVDYGFDVKNLLTLRLDLASDRYSDADARVRFAKQLLERLSGTGGIKSANVWGPGMPGRETWVIEGVAEGRNVDDPRNIVMSARHSVNPGALASMGIPLRRGRDFTWDDDASRPLVAIISESTAKAWWPGEDPIGKRFLPTNGQKLITVIGLTTDVHLQQRFEMSDAAIGIPPNGLGPQRDVYIPYAQRPNRALVITARYQGDAASIAHEVRSAVQSLDATIPLYEVATLEERLESQDQASLAVTFVTGAYALLALFLASLGLFGVLAHAVSRRTQELGIRMALGALPKDVLVMVMREGVGLTLAGIVVGGVGAALLTRVMSSLLFGVSPTDPAVYLAVSVALLGVAAAACFLPARRATKVDPMVALRAE